MANAVYANGMELACKAGSGKVIAAFPDVCMTPPENPATPPGIPVPYPDTAMASDTTKGSKQVKISGKEIMLKNKSYFKTLSGNEAGCAAKKGVISSKIKGKVYFVKWSMDVKCEGENLCRHMDLTTNNHASPMANEAAPWTFLDRMDIPPSGHPCKKDIEEAQKACEGAVVSGGKPSRDCSNCKGDCPAKMSCILVPKGKDKELCCKPDNTGHHLIEDHWIRQLEPKVSAKKRKLMIDFASLADKDGRNFKKPGGPYDGAPTMCVDQDRFGKGKHGIAHGTGGVHEADFIGKKEFTYGDAKTIALEAHRDANPSAKCTDGCIESQLDAFYGKNPKKKCHVPYQKQSLKEDQRTAALKRKRNIFDD